MARAVPPRAEVAREHTWDVESIFASPAEWEAELEAVKADTPGLSLPGAPGRRRGDAPAGLPEAGAGAAPRGEGARLRHWAMRWTPKTRPPRPRATGPPSLHARALAALAFAEPEMLAVGAETLRRWTRDEPRLAAYALRRPPPAPGRARAPPRSRTVAAGPGAVRDRGGDPRRSCQRRPCLPPRARQRRRGGRGRAGKRRHAARTRTDRSAAPPGKATPTPTSP